MIKRIKNTLLLSLIAIETLILTSTSSFALCYSSKTNGEEIHQRSCADVFQAAGLLTIFFEDGGLEQMGTATLIAPDVLITAAHILAVPGRKVKGIYFQPQCNPEITFTEDMGQRPKNIWIHPGYNYDSNSLKHDIALIQLAQPFKHIRPAQLQKTLPGDFYSARTTVVGYGKFGNNNEGPIFTDWKRRAGHLELISDFSKKDLLYMPFTPGKNGSRGFIEAHSDSKYAAIVTPGDSGGPAFIEIKGKPSARIIGIISGNIEKYTKNDVLVSARNRFMSIPYYYSWIESKLRLCNRHGAMVDDDKSIIPDYKNNDSSSSNSRYKKSNQSEMA